MAAGKKTGDDKPIIVVKKVKRVEGGHHGGSWKVAYADFVTAMMAFFLLLWLLSVTTSVQKKKIADYFEPQSVSNSESGTGGVLGGTTISQEGAMSSTVTEQVDTGENSTDDGKQKAADAELDKKDDKSFKEAEENLRQSIESVPELKELAQNLLIDMTPEGLRIQIVDQEGKPMFPLGSAIPLPQAVKLLSIISGVVRDLPNKISVRGHTDSKQFGKDANYTNWELSADRSNASRRVMLASGLDISRIENVMGKADREPLVQNELDSPRNRRISIILLRQSIVMGAKRAEEKFKNRKPGAEKPTPKKREEGVIYFP
ncbi:MAG: flagellar motor protein MotB [Proteobacteria bacterium]|nr:flagellar motor protein MotB [Pseudomonadota bacterium]